MPRALRFLLVLFVLAPRLLPAQERGAVALGELVDGLGVTTRVLVIGAHPDDEDTRLIAWLARGRHVETAYLSLTRGDGGQNLIGNELGEALGVIRTEELLAARRIDGAHQYFTRAYDFGFSKTAEETFTHWPHDSVLGDVVTVVRAFRPHVIITIWSGTPADGHGQHQAAGIVAREAYAASGDTVRFPEARFGRPWAASKLYRAAGYRSQGATLSFNVGAYDPLLGRSYAEIAGESRSQHRSQAMGNPRPKGAMLDRVQRLDARVAAPANPNDERSLFDGIDTSWTRLRALVPAGAPRAAVDSLPAAVAAVRRAFDAFDPSGALAPLARVHRLIATACPRADAATRDAMAGDRRSAAPAGDRVGPSVCGAADPDGDAARTAAIGLRRADSALLVAAGVAVEATAPRELWPVGTTVPVTLTVYDRGRTPVRLLALDSAGASRAVGRTIAPDSEFQVATGVRMDAPTQPWWLVPPRRGDLFASSVARAAEDQRPAAAVVPVTIEVAGVPLVVHASVVHREVDPVLGELRPRVAAVPAISVTLDRTVEYAPANAPLARDLRVELRSADPGAREARVTLALPDGLTADSASRTVTLPGYGSVRAVTFHLTGRLRPGQHEIRAVAESGGQRFAEGYVAIEYPHIRTRRVYRDASLTLEAVDVKLPAGLTVAYVPGVGDNVAPTLRALGVPLTVLDPAQLATASLERFSTVVLGPRAYQASPEIVAYNSRLLDYVRRGGRLVVQYGQYEMAQPGIMPYPVTLGRPADRVTDENAPVTVLDPASPLLRRPNEIGPGDFAGWVQERALYMPRTFDARYAPVLSMHDPGEPADSAAILVAGYGRGTYVYTTLSFFRQLPAGNPGAARLFVNLLAAEPPAGASAAAKAGK